VGTPNVSPDGAFGPQLGWLWAKAPVLAQMATAPAMRMSFILVMFGLMFQRFSVPIFALVDQQTSEEKVADNGSGLIWAGR